VIKLNLITMHESGKNLPLQSSDGGVHGSGSDSGTARVTSVSASPPKIVEF
jgi:hypothetical protein